MTNEEFLQKLNGLFKEIDNYADNEAPDIIGTTAVNFFGENLSEQEFVNNGTNKWPDVKRRTYPKKMRCRMTPPVEF